VHGIVFDEACTEATLLSNVHFTGRGRDEGYPSPPAQIRTCSITAYGSYQRC
jgi:hypothetical protein